MTRVVRPVLMLVVVMLVGCAAVQPDQPDQHDSQLAPDALPAHPSELRFPDRTLSFPDRNDYAHRLPTGDVVYVVPDRTLPLVDITIYSPLGAWLIEGGPALSVMTATLLRDGGAGDMSPDDIDERLDYLASSIRFTIGDTMSSASLDTLSEHLDEVLELLFSMLTEPRFDAERLALQKQRALAAMSRRNDDTAGIEQAFWSELQLGPAFFAARKATADDLDRVDALAMREVAREVFSSGHLVIAVSGDVDSDRIVNRLTTLLGQLPQGRSDYPDIPSELAPAAPGLYGVHKAGVTQSRVLLGHPGVMQGHPDEFALRVMNEILGGGGFTSRLVSRVRSDEGLAYAAGSSFSFGRHWPGRFQAHFQSQHATVAEALLVTLREIRRIRIDEVSDEELATAKESLVAFLAELFTSASDRAQRFASDHLRKLSRDYWARFESQVRWVSAEDVRRVARIHLQESELRVLITGDLDAIADAERGPLVEAVMDRRMKRLSLRDPLTQEPLKSASSP